MVRLRDGAIDAYLAAESRWLREAEVETQAISEPDEEERQQFADRVLRLVEDAIYWAVNPPPHTLLPAIMGM
jgi:hypothetical protein